MTRQQNIAMAQQKFVIQIDSKTLQRVKPFDRAELVECMLKLFSGFSWVNWTNGHSLGRAWQTALSQCGAFCDTKNDKNPAAKYLKAAAKGHKKYWSGVIMTHKNRENTINPSDPRVLALREHGKRMIRTAIDQINLILARYNEYTLDISMSQQAQQESATQTQAAQKHAQSASQPAPESAAQPAQQQMAATSEQKEEPQAQKMATEIPAREVVAKPAVKTVELPQAQKTPTAIPARETVAKPAVKTVELPQAQKLATAIPAREVAANPAVKTVELPQAQKLATEIPAREVVAKPAVKTVELPQVQKTPTAIPARETVAKPAVKTVELPQATKAVAKKPYVAPTATIKQNAQRRPYEKPTVSVRDNPFAKQSTIQATKFAQAQTQLKRQINIFAIRNMNQRAA
ncbi:MAG: hypothetical protein Q4C08_01695 [Pseudomonadota bacterium]|nr:hypothetical protein [Pseudomonadota bacterium]